MATTSIKIEKNIPIPSSRGAAGVSAALRKLGIGDSFLVGLEHRASIRPAAARLGLRITVRTLDDNKIRVWRVS
jgi:hypothetical protein